jgi:2,3-bisphosphoglycerate-dependent phosphoglycerate mutase
MSKYAFGLGGPRVAHDWVSRVERAVPVLWRCRIILEDLGQEWIPVVRDYRLNERHYGALQGLNKAETAAKHGEEQVKIWRRAYAIPPPELDESDERHPSHDPRYRMLPPSVLPKTESLSTTVDRVMPFWESNIAPAIRSGQNVLIAAHGNSLRALVKYLDHISDDEIVELNIPTGA